MAKRGVLHWSPDPIGEALGNLEKFTIDSSLFGSKEYIDKAIYKMIGAAVPEDGGYFTAWHVTDNPFEVEHVLARGGDLLERSYPRHQCGGLSVSSAPDFWKGVSRKKWDFLKDLPLQDAQKLWQAIQTELKRQLGTHYITGSEWETAMEHLAGWFHNRNPYGVVMVSNQPYNINVQDLAKTLGIAKPFEPRVVQVNFHGRYLDMTDREANDEASYLASKVLGKEEGALTEEEVCNVLRAKGWDGAFSRGGFSTNPELAIWNAGKILNFGGWSRG